MEVEVLCAEDDVVDPGRLLPRRDLRSLRGDRLPLDLDLAGITRLFDVARQAWSEAGRGAPYLATSTWFALDDGDGSAREQVHRHLLHYMNWLPRELVDPLARVSGFAGTAAELRDLLKRLEDLGTDEVHLIPTGSDVRQVEQVAALLG